MANMNAAAVQTEKEPLRSDNSSSAALSYSDFRDGYRELLNNLFNELAICTPNSRALAISGARAQSIMRIVYIGQKQNIRPETVRLMVARSIEAGNNLSQWTPVPGVERRAGMLAGSSRLRKIG